MFYSHVTICAHVLIMSVWSLAICWDAQDPYFDTYLAFAALKLASPLLAVRPTLITMLEQAGYFALSATEVAALHAKARAVLNSALRIVAPGPGLESTINDLKEAEAQAPWLYELGCEIVRLEDLLTGTARLDPDDIAREKRVETLHAWCNAWGTLWQRVCDPEEAQEYVNGIVGKRA